MYICIVTCRYGYEGRSSEKCSRGSYNTGKNRDPCTDCGDGYTTASIGSSRSSDCIPAAGFSSGGECAKGA